MKALVRLLALLCLLDFTAAAAESLSLAARKRVPLSPASNEWRVVEQDVALDPRRTALVICDMWDKHWCTGATRRVAEMAPRMNEVIRAARARGIFIIHCPSDTMKFYENTPQRALAKAAPPVNSPVPLQGWCALDLKKEAPLPIDDADGGCDEDPPCAGGSPWRQQISTLELAPGDAITDSAEAYYLMRDRGITNVIVMGVHLNMCVLGRPFAIRQLAAQGLNVLLMRDMTDTMFNSRRRPFVPHCVGTSLMIEHVERFWCPTVSSVAFLGGQEFRFREDQRPHVVFLIGEDEYHTWETLPAFARQELEWRGFRVTVIQQDPADKHQFPGLVEALSDADALVLSLRRRALPEAQMAAVRAHLDAGKPLIGLRTASHSFAPTGDDAKRGTSWTTFDPEVLGGHYVGHHGAGPNVQVTRAPGAEADAILSGVEDAALVGHGSLYRVSPLAADAHPLLLGSIPGKPAEPVAWTHTFGPRHARIFYTSFGHPDDFRDAPFRRLLLNGIVWALHRPSYRIPPAAAKMAATETSGLSQSGSKVAAAAVGQAQAAAATPAPAVGHRMADRATPLAPADAAKTFTVPDDLVVEQVLAEPEIAQPVFLNFDERGRMWVVEYRQYPAPAGLNVVSKDVFWRAVYDKVPEPPPRGVRGRDRITIHEDTDGDGVFDKHTTFLDGLNIVTACARGRGGVWVLNPPYLLFYPDRNNDDVPDGDPEVHLEGFGLEDTHSVINSLRWGPDGWLYAAQGSTVSGKVHRPGDTNVVFSQGQNIWRYRPETKTYEIFAEGGGNAFGVEFDTVGRVFSGHNGGDTRGFHYDQGAYLRKGFEKHGELSNPYAFGYFPQMTGTPGERFTHTFNIYAGGALPGRYAGKLFGVEPLQGRVVLSERTPSGTTFVTRDLERVVTSSDSWFRPVDIKLGPDGALYVADWYDRQVTHTRSADGNIDSSNGRIYRLRAKGAHPRAPFDLAKASSAALVSLLGNTNQWFRETALRLLADRRDAAIVPLLCANLRSEDRALTLGSLWALHATASEGGSAGLPDEVVPALLAHSDPWVSAWTIRLLGDARGISPAHFQALLQLAGRHPDAVICSQLASTAKRLPAEQALPLLEQLLSLDERAADPRFPLLCWWALESKCASARSEVVKLFENSPFWSRTLVEQVVLERVMRRYAAAGTRADLATCAKLLQLAPTAEHARRLLVGFEEAFKGRSLTGLPDELVAAMGRYQVGSEAFRLRRGDAAMLPVALEVVQDGHASAARRQAFLEVLGDVHPASALEPLLVVVEREPSPALQRAALMALTSYRDDRIAAATVKRFHALAPEVRATALTLLATRPAWARALLLAVDAGAVPAAEVPLDFVRAVQRQKDAALETVLARHWPRLGRPATAEMEGQIRRLAGVLQAGTGNPYRGHDQFKTTCAVCHRLFAEGGQVGPDLTTYQRTDVQSLLLHVVNPSAEIREGYENYLVETTDGRSFGGCVVERDENLVVLRGADGQSVNLPRREIATMTAAGLSIMPEGLLDGWNEQQVRDLFAYLRSTQPLPR